MAPHDSLPVPAIELPLPRRPGRRAGPPRAHRPAATAPAAALRVPLTHAQLSELLWAAFGLSRRGSHGRGPLPLHDGVGLELFVCLPEGCYRYEPHEHALLPVTQRDARALASAPGSRVAPALALVAVAGIVAMAGDALASFLKRRLGIASSGQAFGLDQLPESLLPLLALQPLLELPAEVVAGTTLAFVLLETPSAWVAYRLGWRDRPY